MIKLDNIAKGDIVTIDSSHCYGGYSQFIVRHLQYAIRWAYKSSPHEKYHYEVKGIYKHCMKDKYDENKYVVVVENVLTKQIFLMGEKGIIKDGEINI